MDVVLLSRLQFAAATMFHFLFVPLTLGLSVIIAVMETRYVQTGNETYLRMTKFWGKLFLINFALGVVTGITLEFQFGTNWSRYSAYVGDIFGSLLAIEATVAFFLESTFIGIWIFGWKKLSKKTHAAVMWVVALAGNLSAMWILTANGWMQHPVGYVIRNGRAELSDFGAVITNKFALLELAHMIPAALLLGAFFVMGISAYHLLKKQHVDVSTRSFNMALVFGLVASLAVAATGDMHGVHVAEVQPAKLAAMEAHWETQTQAPIVLFAIPDEENERNLIEIGKIPY
ncbi:MAG TPA: cytochrome ubiquinol oxidase subunit I, partial [Desulfobacteraceae bacterium]|nr:cytochrome ubiquinol oxidase subunit I [Desulfobacteraceae bacterium]